MNDRRVPWEEGCSGGVWDADGIFVHVDAVSMATDGDGKRHRGRLWASADAEGYIQVWEDGAVDVVPLPSQCEVCFSIESHAEGCRVAANLARGVPAFWAPWAMWEWGNWRRAVQLRLDIRALIGGQLCEIDRDAIDGDRPPFPLVALGPDGPTTAPWSEDG